MHRLKVLSGLAVLCGLARPVAQGRAGTRDRVPEAHGPKVTAYQTESGDTTSTLSVSWPKSIVVSGRPTDLDVCTDKEVSIRSCVLSTTLV
ncbi:hypothetical protein BC834DRAFT_169156 [Gloeopeniophorella convolvens]|nr:hypothetical protein BC834DRAFT_169156 [Gloeopeniophorella convolvens]